MATAMWMWRLNARAYLWSCEDFCLYSRLMHELGNSTKRPFGGICLRGVDFFQTHAY